jgi:antitoxin YefM
MENARRPGHPSLGRIDEPPRSVRFPVRERRPAMTTITATEARKLLYKLLDDVADSHEPIQIAGKRGNAVLISEDDWRAIQETLYLHSVQAMKESIVEGLKTPVEECEEELDW